jgi:Fe-S-cluster containining protein
MLGYQEFIRETDRMADHLTDYYRLHLVCRPGCSTCCRHDLSLFPVEAAAVRVAVLALAEVTRALVLRQAWATPRACPLLVDDRCAIYPDRPLICRTQGLPLLIVGEDGEQTVDFCPRNFASDGATDCLDESFLVPLERLNSMLVLANLAFCDENGIERRDAGRRTKVSEIVRWTL